MLAHDIETGGGVKKMCVRGQGKAFVCVCVGGGLLFRKQRRRAGLRGACCAATQLARRAHGSRLTPQCLHSTREHPAFTGWKNINPYLAFQSANSITVPESLLRPCRSGDLTVMDCRLACCILLYFQRTHGGDANSTMLYKRVVYFLVLLAAR